MRQGINGIDDWYNCKLKQLQAEKRLKGHTLVNWYSAHKDKRSPDETILETIVRELYPRTKTYSWLYTGGVNDGFWERRSNRLRYLHWLGGKLGWTKPDQL